jgi:hypothetical protein
MLNQFSKSILKAIAISAIGILPSAVSSVSAQSIPPTKDVIGQNVTSVSQLSDVRPTDWAFTALQSLGMKNKQLMHFEGWLYSSI